MKSEVGKPDQEQAYAKSQVTNFTQLFSTSKDQTVMTCRYEWLKMVRGKNEI
jgi:hypothetical protein